MKSFKNFILLLLIFFAVNFLNYSNDVKWECFYMVARTMKLKELTGGIVIIELKKPCRV